MLAEYNEHVKKFHAYRAVMDPLIEELERQDAQAAWRAANPPPPHKQPITSGEMFILTDGEYSDFRIVDLFVALADFDLAALRREGGDTAAELVKRSLATPAPHQEINLYDLD